MNHNPLCSRFVLTALLAAAVLSGSCARKSKTAITLAGSTSVEPFAERLAELYMRGHPGTEISVQGGGSSAGIRAVTDGICQIGMSSRGLTGAETTLTKIPIAIDAIVLIVNSTNPASGLSLVQARDIFAGRIRNWEELGGPKRAITAITREEGSGTRTTFEEKVMAAGMPKDDKGKAEPMPFAPTCLVQNSNGSVREIVATDAYAIGYISVGLVDKRVHALALDGVAPTESTLRNKTYALAREFLFLTRGQATGTTKSFIDFTLGQEGQQSLSDEGLIRIH
jgi:phosphate transport system substrate-binding protein